MTLSRAHCIFSLLAFFLLPPKTFAFEDSVRTKIEYIVGLAAGKVGVAIRGLENDDTLTINGDGKFPMQSVYKFPLALTVLNQVDKGVLSLDQSIHIQKDGLLPNTWSPLREKYPDGNTSITLDALLTYTVSESDNNGCDILFRLLGGPKTVDRYVHNLGITNIAIVATEEEMHKEWNVQYSNWSSPSAMGQLLYMFYHDKILSAKNREYLLQLMSRTNTGPGRLKGLLPKGTVVAHKTGSSGTNEHGIVAATNDVGIVTLPDGNHCVIAVFVSDATADEEACERVIAEIAEVLWNSYSAHHAQKTYDESSRGIHLGGCQNQDSHPNAGPS